MKIKYLILTIILPLILLEAVFSLESGDTRRNYCLNVNDNLSFDIQIYPELKGIFLSFVNNNNKNFTDLSFEIMILRNKTNKIISRTKINLSTLEPNTIFCKFFKDKNFSYNDDLDILFYGLKYKFGQEEEKYYAKKFEDVFRIDKCIDIIRWNRVETLKYNKNIIGEDSIIFKKLCSGTFYLNLGFRGLDVAHIPIKYAKVSYTGKTEEAMTETPANQNLITITLEDDLPIGEVIRLDLKYDIPFKNINKEWKFMLFYPFSTLIYEFNTKNIIPEIAYLSFEDKNITHIKDVGQYTVEITIPDGFTHEGKPKELIYDEQIKQEVLKDGSNSTIGVVYPSFSCLNISSFPSSCVKFSGNPSPKEEKSKNVITWSSTIINGDPKKLSFDLTEDYRSRFIFFALFLTSLILIYLTIKLNKYHIEIILSYCVVLIVSKIAPMPGYLTLFDILATITLLIVLALFLFKRKEKIKEYYCIKCKRHHKITKRLYEEHFKFKK